MMIRIPTHREPIHPGEMLLREFLKPLGITQRDFANRIGVPYQRVNEIVNGRRGVTPSTALRLGRCLGTSANIWLNLQQRWDLYHAQRLEAAALGRIRRLSSPRAARRTDPAVLSSDPGRTRRLAGAGYHEGLRRIRSITFWWPRLIRSVG